MSRPGAVSPDKIAPGVAVESMNDGQRGVIVELAEGGLGVQLDRGTSKTNQSVVVPFRPGHWSEAQEPRLQTGQLGRVTYEADRALLIARGEFGVPEWHTLRELDRIEWTRGGPPRSDPQRRRLHAAITGVLATK